MLQMTSVVPTNAGRLLFARLDGCARDRGTRTPAILAACVLGRSSSRPAVVRVFGAAKQFAQLGGASVLDRAVGVA